MQLRRSEEKSADKLESMRHRYVAKINAVNSNLEKAKHDLAVALNIEVPTDRRSPTWTHTDVEDGADDQNVRFVDYAWF